MTAFDNLLAGPPPTLLPDSPAREEITGGAQAYDVARRHPDSPWGWAVLSQEAFAEGRIIEAYAFARVGYHRGLDLLRRNGWKGHGPVPWSHQPNRGWLVALHMLGVCADAIGESDEAVRCAQFLRDSSAEAADELAHG